MGIETMDNINRKELAKSLLKKGRELFSEISKNSENLTDLDLNELCNEADETMLKLKSESRRDYIELAGRAINVYRKIGKQYEAEQLILENQERLK